MNPYTILAKYYDKLSYDCDYDKWSQYLFLLISKQFNGKTDIKGADGACGSGNITIKLKHAGLNVYGFDLSQDMLAAAVNNAAANGTNLQFVKADLVDFKPHKKLDFITIANDGINYIKPQSLLKCFKNCYNNLKKGGLLLFDISSEYKLKELIGNNTFSDDNEEVTYIWNNSFEKGENEVDMDLIFFVRDGSKYLRFDENHIQYIYKNDFIKEVLIQAGFSDIKVYNFLKEEKPLSNSQRIQFTAVKNE